MFWQPDRMMSSVIDDMSLTLSTCNVLVIYKVLALVCALCKSDRQTTIRCKYFLAARHKKKPSTIDGMSLTLLLVIYKVLADNLLLQIITCISTCA